MTGLRLMADSPPLLRPSNPGIKRTTRGHRCSESFPETYQLMNKQPAYPWPTFSICKYIFPSVPFCRVAAQILASTSVFEYLSNPLTENKHDVILFNQAIH